jgi:hypothetical protein
VWLTIPGDRPRSVKLFPGAVAASATDGEHLGIVYVVDEPLPATPKTFRYQSYFTVVGRDGKVVVPKVALGDKTASHGAPGPAVVWNAQAKEWGVLWMEGFQLSFARLDAKGKLLGSRVLSKSGQVQHLGHLLWTGSTYAYVIPSAAGVVLLEFDDQKQRETILPTASALEPVVAFANDTYGIAFRSARELAFARVKGGKELGRSVIAAVPMARPVGGGGGQPVPAPMGFQPTLGNMAIAADGGQFVLVWGENRVAQGFNDRLMIARLDAASGAAIAGFPHRLDQDDVHQDYASIAGTGCDLAVSYILGDPNGKVRVALVKP